MFSEIKLRRTDRKPVVLEAQCRTGSGMRGSGELSDISTKGCCITTRDLSLSVGSRLVVRPEGLEGLTGVVRWIDGSRAGVEFETPLYAPVMEHLAKRHADGKPVALHFC